VKGDPYIKADKDDDGEVIVTKSSKTAAAIFGRLGDGRPLLVYVYFASSEEHDASRTQKILSLLVELTTSWTRSGTLLRGATRAMRREV
jgi:hypothetical protein